MSGGFSMPHVQTKIFKSNRSQAGCLPRAVAFPESIIDVEITAIGNRRIITPAGQSWDEWFDAPGVSSDFMIDRLRKADRPGDGLKIWSSHMLVYPKKKWPEI